MCAGVVDASVARTVRSRSGWTIARLNGAVNLADSSLEVCTARCL